MKFLSHLMHHQSFFRRFLFSYVLVLVIPFTTIMITYYQSDRTIREEILDSSTNSLHQFFNVWDAQFSEMQRTAFQSLNLPTIQELIHQPTLSTPLYGYKVYEARQSLANFPRYMLDDCFMYFSESDTVISAGRSSLVLDQYFNTYYRTACLDGLDLFKTKLIGEKSFVPQLVTLGGSQTAPLLALVMSRGILSKPGGTNVNACLVLNTSILQKKLLDTNSEHDGILAIFDKEGNVIASSQELPANINLSEWSANQLFEEKLGNERYIVQAFPSEMMECTYVSFTPTSAFWDRLIVLRIICLTSILFCAVLSTFISVVLTKHNFHPITSILSTLHSGGKTFDSRKGNEMDFIRQTLAKTLEENRSLSSKVDSAANTIRENFLLRALQNTLVLEKDEEDAFSANQIYLLTDLFSVVIIRLEQVDETIVGLKESDEGRKNISFILSNVFEDLCFIRNQGFLFSLTSTEFVGILNFSSFSNCKRDMREVCDRLSEFLAEQFGIKITVAMSGIQSGLPGIHLAYQQAERAIAYRYLYGSGSIIDYSDISERPFCYGSVSDDKLVQILQGYIKHGQPESSQDCVSQVFESVSINVKSSLEDVRCFQYELFNTLYKSLHEMAPNSMRGNFKKVQQILEVQTLEELHTLLENILESFRREQTDSHEQHTICDRAAEYIRQHYADPSLNNNSLGEILGISPSYLSKLFKEWSGVSPLSYLYTLRINRAKELLRDTTYTMEKIAAQTGFLNGTALIKTFKKIEGITPGVYRKLMQK